MIGGCVCALIVNTIGVLVEATVTSIDARHCSTIGCNQSLKLVFIAVGVRKWL